MTPEERLAELGLELHAFPIPDTMPLRPVVVDGRRAYVSGQPPARDGKIQYFGRVGEDLSVDEGYAAAKECALNILGALKKELGELSRIERIVKLLGLVCCAPDFKEQAKVIHGASDLFVELFGENGRHARTAMGVIALPGGMAVEIEAIVALRS